jgi:hypothetical protein
MPRVWLGLACLSALSAFWAVFIYSAPDRLSLYVEFAAPLAFASLFVFSVSAAAYVLSTRLRAGLARDVLVSLIFVGVVSWFPAENRIEADESNMVATAQGIYNHGTPVAPVAGVFRDDGVLVATHLEIDKRGSFFPAVMVVTAFLLSKLIGGGSEPLPIHAFIVNFFASFAVFIVLTRLARRFVEDLWLVVLPGSLLLAFPVFLLYCRSGTFDVLNLAFILFVIHIFLSFAARPTGLRFTVLMSAVVCLSQLRYESSLFCLGIVAGTIAVSYNPRVGAWRPVHLLIPWLFVPAGLRLAVPFNHELPAGETSAWSLGNIVWNGLSFLKLAFSGQTAFGSNIFFPPLLLFGFLFFLPHLLRNRGRLHLTFSYGWAALAVVLAFCAVTGHYWGRADHPVSSRYFIPYVAFLLLLVVVAVGKLALRPVVKIVFCSVLVVAAPVAGIRQFESYREISTLKMAFNSRQASLALTGSALSCHADFLTDLPVTLLVNGVSAMPAGAFQLLGSDRLSQIAGRPLYAVPLPHPYEDPGKYAGELARYSGGLCVRDRSGIEWSRSPPAIRQWDRHDRSGSTWRR